MRLLCVGFNWKTPVRWRERLGFEGPKQAEALARLKQAFSDPEFAVLSTCNRTEIYSAMREGERMIGSEELCEFLANYHGVSLTDFYDHLYFHEDTSVALHLFKVAGGLDSMVLGEAQILGQVKQAYQAAVERGAAGPLLHSLFQRSLAVAKRIQTETALTKGRLSIASAAVDYIRGVFDHFADKTVLVIGAGKMAELALTHLRELNPGAIVVCNRNRQRAEELVARFGGSVRPFDELFDALASADIVISSTGAEEPIAKVEDFRRIVDRRKHRLMAIIDIAVPRDFDVAIGQLDNVLLWNIDDLEKVRYHTLRSRESELEKALKIADSEAGAFQAVIAFQQSGPVIGLLEQEFQRITEQELERLFGQLNGIPDDQREKIRYFAHRLKNKFLHPPKAALRAEAKSGTHLGLLDALRKLFGLEQ